MKLLVIECGKDTAACQNVITTIEKIQSCHFTKSQKNPELKKKWMQVLKRKGVREPNSSHRVCSAHFAGGTKTYMNNTPTVFAQVTKSRPRKKTNERKIIDVKNDLDIPEVSSHFESTTPDVNVESNANNNELGKLKKEIISLQAKNEALQEKYDKDTADLKCELFQMERFIGSDTDFRFYTGFPNYNCFKAFFDYLLPHVRILFTMVLKLLLEHLSTRISVASQD